MLDNCSLLTVLCRIVNQYIYLDQFKSKISSVHAHKKNFSIKNETHTNNILQIHRLQIEICVENAWIHIGCTTKKFLKLYAKLNRQNEIFSAFMSVCMCLTGFYNSIPCNFHTHIAYIFMHVVYVNLHIKIFRIYQLHSQWESYPALESQFKYSIKKFFFFTTVTCPFSLSALAKLQ